VSSGHPRARGASASAEAAAKQGKFWEMVELLFADQGRLDPPHLWQRAESLGLDLTRFDADMQDPAVEQRITEDFRAALRAGVATTPTLLVNGRLEAGVPTVGNLQDWAA